MADQLTPEAQALAKQPKAFTLPPAPELSAINAQIGGVPGVSETSAKRPEFKTSAEAAAEQERQLQKLSQVEAPIMAAEQAGKEYGATAKADIARQFREQSQNIQAGLDLAREKFPYPEFKPTQENMQSLATLFSLVGVIGVSMGGTGKLSAMNSLNAMSGMMKGWQQGRKDLWEKEKAEFDKGMARTKAILEDVYKDADRAYKALADNREEAMALAGQSVAKLGSQVGKQILEKQGIERYISYLDGIRKDLRHAEDLVAKEKREEAREDRRDAREIARREHSEIMQQRQFAQSFALLNAKLQQKDNKPVKEKEAQQIEGLTSLSQELKQLEKEFKDEYAGLGLLGFGAEASMEAKRRLGTEEGAKAVQWWAKYERLQAPNRHALFGATLTGNELKSYQGFTAKKSDNPNIVRNMLLDQADYSDATARGRVRALEDSGYKVPEMRPRSFLGTYSTQQQAAPAAVRNFSSVDEAEKANLPRGTKITINGRSATVE
jgi:hypothetical protein